MGKPKQVKLDKKCNILLVLFLQVVQKQTVGAMEN